MVLWGMGAGLRLKAMWSSVIPAEKRATGFGMFDTIFGGAWFIGSAIMGLLYNNAIVALIVFSVLLQLSALPLFASADRTRASK